MGLRKLVTPRSIIHTNLGKPDHWNDAAYFKSNQISTFIRIAEPPIPAPKIGYQQLGRFGSGPIEMKGSGEKGLDSCINAWVDSLPPIRRLSGGRYKKVGGPDKGHGPARVKSALRLDTVTLPWYLTSAMAVSYGEAEFVKSAEVAVQRFEDLTGRKVKGWNWHLDTGHYHLDLFSTDINEEPGEYVTKSLGITCYSVGKCLAISGRKLRLDFVGLDEVKVGEVTLEESLISKKRLFEAAEGRIPTITEGDRCCWDLAVGSALDVSVESTMIELNPKLLEANVEVQIKLEKERRDLNNLATGYQELRKDRDKLRGDLDSLKKAFDVVSSENINMKTKLDGMDQTIRMLVVNAEKESQRRDR